MRRSALAWCVAVVLACGGGTGEVIVSELPDVAVDEGGGEVGVETGPEAHADVPPDAGADADVGAGEAGLPDRGGDWGPQEGEAGWPCQSGSDCQDGYCIRTPDGMECTIVCVEECPFDWKCLEYGAGGPDQVSLCLPPHVELCRPCKTNAECFSNGVDAGEACVQYGGEGDFCGSACAADGDCPEGYACQASKDVAGGEGLQCVKQAGVCGCKAWFADEGATTGCFVDNEWGVCEGTRGCFAGGLSDCDAAVPAQETCNGSDDDCDGEADEELGGSPCPVSNEFGTCEGTLACVNGKAVCGGTEPAAELCDGKDNDCDGLVDDGFPDTDKDGLADCLEADKDGDEVPDGLDNCPNAANPDQEDFDLDTIGDACDPDDDNDLTADGQDCAALDPAVHPGAVEACDGKDSDCDGLVDEGFIDSDSDGFKDCTDDDDDNDGTNDPLDCGPLDPAMHPGASEVCDGKDNDCDFAKDEGFPDQDADLVADCVDPDKDGDGTDNDADNCPGVKNPAQEDMDQDGVGDACDSDLDGDSIPDVVDNCPGLKNTPQSDIDGDGLGDPCDSDKDGDGAANAADNCPLVPNPGQEDIDQDGVGDACEADKDGDGTPDALDCAPADPLTHPGANEACDGLDNDCDAMQDEGFPDADKDGLKDCVDPDDDGDGAPDDLDCAPLDPAVHPAAVEVCNGKDDNCDGLVDEGLGNLSCGKGQCSHSVPACKEGKPQGCDPMEGAAPEACDGKDNDCDGLIDEDLGSTSCGLGMCLHTVKNCIAGKPKTCDPKEGAADEECDGLDNDCDGKVDEEQGTLLCGEGVCFHKVPACLGGVSQECDPMQGATPEVCDGVDNDCDAATDEELGSVTCGKGECVHEEPYCVNGKIVPCDPFKGVAKEECDGKDNDCDGLADEELGSTTCGLGFCLHTVANCTAGVPQTCEPLDGATAEECDGKDNDCDGMVDEALGYMTCGLGECEHTVANCEDGKLSECDPMQGWTLEVCDGLDNDCDGEADPENADGCVQYYQDADADGFGVEAAVRCLCNPDPPYSATVPGDCNDLDKAIHPLAQENCKNAADENCDAKVNDGCVYLHCKEALQYNPTAASGAYTIDVDAGGPLAPFAVYCDMTTDGGGWTLVMKQAAGSGYGSPLSVKVWNGWSTANKTMAPEDATLSDQNMVNLAYSQLAAEKIRMTASQTWKDIGTGAWVRTINTTPFDALSDAKANQTGNEGGSWTTPWPAGSFTDHTWTSTTTGNGLCWRTGPYFNRTSYQYTEGGIKWGWFFNNECYENTTDTGEGLGCCGNSGWYRASNWTLYLWAR